MKLPEWVESPNPNRYLENDYTVADFETTNRDKGTALRKDNRIVLATWLQGGAKKLQGNELGHSNRDGSVYQQVQAHFGDEFHQRGCVESIESSGFLVVHHSKFELQWLARCGVESGSKLVWDTMLAEKCLAGNRKWNLSLEATAQRYGLGGKVSVVKLLIDGGVCPSEIPEQWLLEYGCEDTNLCHQIFLRQRILLEEMGLLPVVFTRCLLTPVLADIEMRGVQLDAKRVKEEYERTLRATDQARKRLSELGGEINWGSSKQVAELLYGAFKFEELRRGRNPDRTDGGKPRTDKDTIGRLRCSTQEQRKLQTEFTEYKKLEKKLENLEKLKACCEIDEGRLYANYNQAVAGTHRLTSNGLRHKVQLHNIDVSLKRLFKAREKNWSVGEADGIQLEFRVAAHLGRDPVALSDIRDPAFDAHWQTAEELTGKSRKELSKEIDRYRAKPSTFRPLYGGMAGDAALRRYIKFFQTKYAKIYETQTAWTNEVLKTKQLRTETGLIFYWPDTVLESTANGRGYIRNRTAIFNYPVQSLATADIIPIALVYFWYRAKAMGLNMFIVNTVHDSVVAEVPKEEQEAFYELARRCFTMDCFDYLNRVYHIDFVSPLGCEIKIGDHWGEAANESKFDLDPLDYKKVA